MMSKGFAEFVEGKRIALIGGAKDANEERAAEADIVARCNLYIGEGQRCDMAFLAGDAPDTPPAGLRVACVNIRSNRCLESVRRWPGLSALKVFGFYNAVYAGVSPHGHDQEWLNLFGHQLGSMPLCGILAARWLTLCDIRSLYVTGFDFYIGDPDAVEITTRGKRVWQRGPHELGTQLRWLLSLEQFDSRVVLDMALHRVCARAEELGFL